MNLATIAGLYGAGLLTFASPCVLPLLPVYVGILGGAGAGEGGPSRLRRAGVGFAVGLGVVFVALGMGASLLTGTLSSHRRLLLVVAGTLMVFFGLKLLGLFKSLDGEARPFLDRVPAPNGFFGGALFGAAFGIGWTPCVGPVLGATLTYAASSTASPWLAGLELGVYAAGLASPLVAAAFAANHVLSWTKKLREYTVPMQRATGVLLVALGALLVMDRVSVLNVAPTITKGGTASAAEPCASSATACAKVIDAPPSAEGLVGKPRLVEFVSGTCTVCAKMHPVVEALAKRCAGDGSLLRISVDDDAGRSLASRYGVRVVPTFVSVDAAGSEVERLVGEQTSERLSRALIEVRGEDCPGS
ncbi:MAG: cytochrome c biogenesis protein CcdA [Polyangiales bacterium]